MMNILFLYPRMFHPHRGGIERVTDLLCREFLNRSYRVFYLNSIREEALLEYSYPVPVFFFPYPIDDLENNGIYFKEFLQLHQIDVVINQDPIAYHTLFRYSKDVKGVHVISVVHNTPTWIYDYLLALTVRLRNDTIIERFKSVARYLKVPGIKRDYLNRLKDCYRDCFNYTDFLCLLSLKFIPDLERVYKGELSKIIAIGNPNTYTTKEEIALTSKKKQLLYVGRVEWYQKRADRLVYIWKHLYQKFPDWELVIVGDGPIREDMERKFSQIERVRFTGYQDPDLYYRDAGILCLTSDFEGWPMVLMEAMTFGTVPVIFNSFAAATDILDEGKTGILVPPFSLKEYVRKLSLIMSDDHLRMRMSQSCINGVKKFDVKRIVDQWEDVFRSFESRV